MKIASIAGELEHNARITEAGNGATVANFTVRVRNRRGGSDLMVSCAVWGRLAEAMADYLLRGAGVAVGGEFDFDSYNGAAVLKITARDVTILRFAETAEEHRARLAPSPPATGPRETPAKADPGMRLSRPEDGTASRSELRARDTRRQHTSGPKRPTRRSRERGSFGRTRL